MFVGALALVAAFVLLRPAPPLPDAPIHLPAAAPDSVPVATSGDVGFPAPSHESSPPIQPSESEHRRRRTADFPPAQEPPAERMPSATGEPGADAPPSPRSTQSAPNLRSSVVDNVTVRDRGERVVYRGSVDVGPTLERIAAGQRLDFPDDGTVFQNRERRLPSRPRGYYHEYVLQTPGLPGPGPQRVVIGGDGEVYYTPDHYRTFRALH